MDAIANKPAPTFWPHSKGCTRSSVGAGLLAMTPAQALKDDQNSTLATSAKRLAKWTVIPSFRYSGNSSKLPRFGSGKISS